MRACVFPDLHAPDLTTVVKIVKVVGYNVG